VVAQWPRWSDVVLLSQPPTGLGGMAPRYLYSKYTMNDHMAVVLFGTSVVPMASLVEVFTSIDTLKMS
jgi:hypothetical protein